jgi:hypothetical protein
MRLIEKVFDRATWVCPVKIPEKAGEAKGIVASGSV